MCPEKSTAILQSFVDIAVDTRMTEKRSKTKKRPMSLKRL